MARFEIRITINRPVTDVFAVYTDTDKWQWCSYIREARWVRGKPWVAESRMLIQSDTSTVDQVLTHFEPNRRVDYISHFSGITMEARVTFRSISDQETGIHGQMEFVGTLSRVVGFAVGPAIEQGTRQFFEDLKKECERQNAQSA